jgi:hypothetical protein
MLRPLPNAVEEVTLFPRLALALFAITACSGGGGLGADCSDSGDCRDDLQCLQGVCTPRCQGDSACGDGFVCQAGECRAVVSAAGDPCDRERACGPGQRCLPDLTDGDGDGMLAATCQPEATGGATGADCTIDATCASGTCVLGRCTELCAQDDDCAGGLNCALIPRVAVAGSPLLRGCLQAGGALVHRIPVLQSHQTILVPVPSTALSFALVTRIGDDTQLAGVARVISPSGTLLYDTPTTVDEFYANPLRHQPAPAISTLLVPNTPALDLETGVYLIEVGSFFPAGGNGTAVPDVEVVYKLGSATTLDLNLYFLDLADHPCALAGGFAEVQIGTGKTLDATTAPDLPGMDDFLQELQTILSGAGISIGQLRFLDLPGRPELDGLRAQDLSRLLQLSTHADGINLYFVRSIAPVGIQALAGGNPGPPGLPGTSASGIAVSVDTLCYRGWTDLARATAHQLGRFMGLYRNREPDGHSDPIPDSGSDAANLMYFSEFGGTALSAGQAQVLRLYPGLR